MKITDGDIILFREKLKEEEKSEHTVEKYIRDVSALKEYSEEVEKETLLKYKEELKEKYKTSSVNSIISSINAFTEFMGEYSLKLKSIKTQKSLFIPEEKELTRAEFTRLCRTAKEEKKKRLYMILQTVCATGIRISELQYITVEGVKNGYIQVDCKGKCREVFIVKELKKKLLEYAEENKIKNGSVFVTKGGKPLNRSNIWREMKELCKRAKVNPKKVFPHNLRHLFARVYYKMQKDIAKLADILGHSSINTTRIYIISTGAEHRKQMERMKLII